MFVFHDAAGALQAFIWIHFKRLAGVKEGCGGEFLPIPVGLEEAVEAVTHTRVHRSDLFQTSLQRVIGETAGWDFSEVANLVATRLNCFHHEIFNSHTAAPQMAASYVPFTPHCTLQSNEAPQVHSSLLSSFQQ